MAATAKKLHISDDLSLPLDAVTQTFGILAKKRRGKRLSVDTPLPTPDGWTTMGEVRLGDRLFDEKGEVCRVTAVHPIFIGDSYRVCFSDGSTILADAEHLWETHSYAFRRAGSYRRARALTGAKVGRDGRRQCEPTLGPNIVTTAEIAATIRHKPSGALNHAIVNALSLCMPEAELPLDPYALGVWLGDGTRGYGSFTTADPKIVDLLRADGFTLNEQISQRVNNTTAYTIIGIRPILAALGVLHDKFIPQAYLRASKNQRLRLLQGLMDTDGSARKEDAEISSSYPKLADGICELIVSLGMKYSRTVRQTTHRPSTRIVFAPMHQVFRLSRKASRYAAPTVRRERRYITAVEKIDDIPMRCIAVDSPRNLFLAGTRMIPTHNTYTASVMAEEMIKANLPFVVLDPTGAWWGLRASADGKKVGYPVVIIGGDHADIPLESAAGAVIADLVVEHPGWYVVDMSAMNSNAEQDRFAMEFGERLYRVKNRHRFPMHLYVDEADAFIPQQPMPEQRRMLGAYDTIVRRGGIRGLGVTLISQRPAVVNKNVLSQVECLIVLQIVGAQDRDAIERWVGAHGAKKQCDALMSSLASLGLGESWFWSPAWLDVFKRVQVRKRETFNSSKTPEVGEHPVSPKVLAKVDLDQLRDKISATIERVKADDPRELRKQISELQRQLKAKPQTPTAKPEVKTIETPAFTKDDLRNLRKIANDWPRALGKIRELHDVSKTHIDSLDHLVDNHITWLLDTIEKANKSLTPVVTAHARQPLAPTTARAMPPVVRLPKKPVDQPQENVVLDGPKQRILNAIAWFESIGITEPEITAVAFLAGYTVGGGAFNNPRGTLRNAGYIEYRGSKLALTDVGRHFAQVPDDPLTADALLQRVYGCLPGPEQKILKVVVNAYPNDITDEELAERTGYAVDGGAFKNPKGRLRTLGLIAYPARKRVRAAELLFLSGDRPQRRISR